MNSIISTLAAIVVLVGAFVWGRSSTPPPEIEVITKIDTIHIVDTRPDTIIQTKYITTYLTTTDTVEVTKVDSVLVYLPISTYVFGDSTYRAEISGYEVALKSMEIYRSNTTLQYTPKLWHINAGVASYTNIGSADISLRAGVEYRKNRWSISGDYVMGMDGSSGVAITAQYSLLSF
ncbi:MAG: DUF6808 domain-containing protein [Rikenellaceae bacterium]